MIAFGPVPSRRLGRSVGINNIPAKNCTYSCVYCQLGRTGQQALERKEFYDPEIILAETKELVQRARLQGEIIDYLTFVPDGEPTLDINLKREIELLRELDIPLAILTNASLIWRNDVRETLCDLDLVSLKIDAASERLWKRIDRPHKKLELQRILDGILDFSDQYNGTIITETMFVDGIDYSDEIERLADFISDLKVNKAYVAIPTRPPAEDWVRPPCEEMLNRAFCSFSDRLGPNWVELLIGYEGDVFASIGNFEDDLLSITSVHPMRKEAVEKLVEKSNASWEKIVRLLKEGSLIELRYEGDLYYMRRLLNR